MNNCHIKLKKSASSVCVWFSFRILHKSSKKMKTQSNPPKPFHFLLVCVCVISYWHTLFKIFTIKPTKTQNSKSKFENKTTITPKNILRQHRTPKPISPIIAKNHKLSKIITCQCHPPRTTPSWPHPKDPQHRFGPTEGTVTLRKRERKKKGH